MVQYLLAFIKVKPCTPYLESRDGEMVKIYLTYIHIYLGLSYVASLPLLKMSMHLTQYGLNAVSAGLDITAAQPPGPSGGRILSSKTSDRCRFLVVL